jgi:rod shape determining protein RodA
VINRLLLFLGRHVDSYLLAAVGALLVVGMITLYSASGESFGRVGNQLVNIGLAFTVMWLAANIPPHILQRLAMPVYILGLILLVAVALFGEITNGARRWLDIGVTRIQPSELMKIAVPLALAWYFDRYEAILKLRDFVIGAVMLGIPVLLVMEQPDLGTALLIAIAGFFVIFLAGLSWRIIIGMAVTVLASLPVLWSFMHEYQQRRVLTLLDPDQDPLGAGYHTIQAAIALGSGGFFGKGWLNGTQAHLDFLPERSTDFIFAVFSEEFGLFGNLILVTLFLFVIGRGMFITFNASTLFTRLAAGAITLTFFTYVAVNMGMVSGILPVVGVPLPLISYGGTSLVSILFGMGILMSIHTHKPGLGVGCLFAARPGACACRAARRLRQHRIACTRFAGGGDRQPARRLLPRRWPARGPAAESGCRARCAAARRANPRREHPPLHGDGSRLHPDEGAGPLR